MSNVELEGLFVVLFRTGSLSTARYSMYSLNEHDVIVFAMYVSFLFFFVKLTFSATNGSTQISVDALPWIAGQKMDPIECTSLSRADGGIPSRPRGQFWKKIEKKLLFGRWIVVIATLKFRRRAFQFELFFLFDSAQH